MTANTTGLAQIGVTGLATMGRNLARNIASHGYRVAVHNRTYARTEALLAEHGREDGLIGMRTLKELVATLERPRRVLIMVKAGTSTDAVIDELVGLLDAGDIVIDGGNAHFEDTRRREAALRLRGLHFVGAGVSGGEEGALKGPSIMPGGSVEAYQALGAMFEQIAAQVEGMPCCRHIGSDGAGHFVKMVHNGIEYADMQLIGEAYDLLRRGLRASPKELADIFHSWNSGDLHSFLVEITAELLAHVDADTGQPFVDVVADQAGQKGTGGWTVQVALDLGVPVSGIAEAVFARALSGNVAQREAVRLGLTDPEDGHWVVENRQAFVDHVQHALYASKVVAYAQGFDMIRAASTEYAWDIDLGGVATIWRGGCIIRARFLDRIRDAYDREPELPSLLTDDYFRHALTVGQEGWRRTVASAAQAGIPAPGFAGALAYFDGLRADRLPAALIQAQRDFFGAHTYRRVDRDGVFHTDWSGDRRERQLAAV